MAEFTQLKNVLRGQGFKLVSDIKQDLTEADKVASGKLRNSIKFELLDSNSLITLLFKAARHWINVNDGRGKNKGFPPVNKISRWIKQKGLSLVGVPMKSVTFLIGRHLSVNPIAPTNIFTDRTKEFTRELVRIIGTSALPDVQRQAGDILRQFSTTKVEFRK